MSKCPDAENATRSLYRILVGRNSATITAVALITVAAIASKLGRKQRSGGKLA
jgi:hypothetical protein